MPLIGTSSIHRRFESDFASLSARLPAAVATDFPGAPEEMEAELIVDLSTNTKWMSYYLPLSDETFAIIKSVAESCQDTMGEIAQSQIRDHLSISGLGDPTSRRYRQALFTGKVYFYYETELEPQQMADLLDLYRAHQLTLELRGPHELLAGIGGG